MNCFVRASEINDNEVEVNYKVEDEVEEYHRFIMKEYNENELEAFLTIFQKYSLDFIMYNGIYHIKNKAFNDYLIKIKSDYFKCIGFIINNDYNNGKVLLYKILNDFKSLYTFELSNSKYSSYELKTGLYKMEYILNYLRAYIERKVLI